MPSYSSGSSTDSLLGFGYSLEIDIFDVDVVF
jgi:hypothetical protein